MTGRVMVSRLLMCSALVMPIPVWQMVSVLFSSLGRIPTRRSLLLLSLLRSDRASQRAAVDTARASYLSRPGVSQGQGPVIDVVILPSAK